MATTTPRPTVEQCSTFVPDSPRAPGLCATCGDSQSWHRAAYRAGQLAEQRHQLCDPAEPPHACHAPEVTA